MASTGWQKYHEVKCIGNGAFGTVHLVDGIPSAAGPEGRYVIKRVQVASLNEKELKDAVNEVFILRMLDHPNVINYLDHFICAEGYLNIVMEYCSEGDLNQLIQEQRKGGRENYLAEDRVFYMSFQLLQALKYVHGIKILHRDLKPGNILVGPQRRIKICDFGISKRLTETVHAVTVVGTPFYLAPEICESKPYGSAGDIWAAGCVIYELAALRRAFEASNLLAVVRRITSGEYPALPSCFSESFHRLVAKMLTTDPDHRPSVEELINEFFVMPLPNHVVEEIMESEELLPEPPPTPPPLQELQMTKREGSLPVLTRHGSVTSPSSKVQLPSKARDMNRKLNKWDARLHRMADHHRDDLQHRAPSNRPPATHPLRKASAGPSKPVTPVGPPVVRSKPFQQTSDISGDGTLRAGGPAVVPKPWQVTENASDTLPSEKSRVRKKGAMPEIEFCLMPHQRNLFVRRQEYIPPEAETAVAEPRAPAGRTDQITEEIAEEVPAEAEVEDDYDYVFEPYVGPEEESSDTVERPFREPRVSISSKNLVTAALCKSIDEETVMLRMEFEKRLSANRLMRTNTDDS